MRDLSSEKIKTKIDYNSKPKPKRINCQISCDLIIKCHHLIKSKKLGGDYSINSISDLIRQSLKNYQAGQPLTCPRPDNCSRQTIGFLLAETDWLFYNNLPKGQRTEIIERCLASYLNTL